jgi:hypothetical protein
MSLKSAPKPLTPAQIIAMPNGSDERKAAFAAFTQALLRQHAASVPAKAP